MQRIMVGIDRPEEAEAVIRAGANELYCGLATGRGCLNVYSEVSLANLTSFDDLTSVVHTCHSLGVPLYLARNLRQLTHAQVMHSLEEIEQAMEIGIDGVIVADLQLLSELVTRAFPLKIIGSSLIPIFNTATVSCLTDLGLTRIILPKQVSLLETRQLVISNPHVEFEVFVFFQGCHHVDAFCRTDHEKYRVASHGTEVTIGRIVSNSERGDNHSLSGKGILTCQSVACGVCGLYLLADLKELNLKIASRGKSTERKVMATKLVAEVVTELANKQQTKQTFMENVKVFFRTIHGHHCSSFYCYCEGSWKEDITFQPH